MNFILHDELEIVQNLLPFTHTRPVSEVRCGILTMKEKWDLYLNTQTSYSCSPHLSKKYKIMLSENEPENVWINSSVFPNQEIVDSIHAAIEKKQHVVITTQDIWIASIGSLHVKDVESISLSGEVKQLKHLWDIFKMNDDAIRSDFQKITTGRKSTAIDNSNQVLGDNIFIEEGAKVFCSIINTLTGPVYIAKDAEIMEGSVVRGPLAMGEGSVLKMGTKVYGATTIGKGSKVGGELNNVVLFANSNKAHDGFLGNAVIGEWCNLGADTNNSNLKNNYEEVRLWNENLKTFEKTGLQFCGLMMGDHSKCGINTMFNTGTVVGVSCNVYGAGFPRNFIPSFSWGSANGFIEYQLKKAIETAKRVYERRMLDFDSVEEEVLNHVFEVTKDQRVGN